MKCDKECPIYERSQVMVPDLDKQEIVKGMDCKFYVTGGTCLYPALQAFMEKKRWRGHDVAEFYRDEPEQRRKEEEPQ